MHVYMNVYISIQKINRISGNMYIREGIRDRKKKKYCKEQCDSPAACLTKKMHVRALSELTPKSRHVSCSYHNRLSMFLRDAGL